MGLQLTDGNEIWFYIECLHSVPFLICHLLFYHRGAMSILLIYGTGPCLWFFDFSPAVAELPQWPPIDFPEFQEVTGKQPCWFDWMYSYSKWLMMSQKLIVLDEVPAIIKLISCLGRFLNLVPTTHNKQMKEENEPRDTKAQPWDVQISHCTQNELLNLVVCRHCTTDSFYGDIWKTTFWGSF